MNTTTPETLWADSTIDPGPVRSAAPTRAAATRSLLAAIRAGALPDLPEHLAALPAARTRFEEFERAVLTGPQIENAQQLVARYAAGIVAGGDTIDPGAFAAQVHTANQAAAVADAMAYTLGAIRRETDAAVSAALTAGADTMLDGIRAEVSRVMTQARQAATALAGVDISDPSAVAAAAGGQRTALASLADLARDYNRARRLHRDVLVATGEPVGKTDHSPSTFSWAETFTLGIHECKSANLADHGPSTDLAPMHRLLALAARGDVWLPSREELQDRWDELHHPRKKYSREEEQREEAAAARHKVTDRRATATATA